MLLSNLTVETLSNHLRDILTEDMLHSYLKRIITEYNFTKYETFFRSLENPYNLKEVEFKNLIKVFLLYNESINVSEIDKLTASVEYTLPDSDTRLNPEFVYPSENDIRVYAILLLETKYLPILFAELEFFTSSEVGIYPNKLFLRDHMFNHYYQKIGKDGYRDYSNLDKELTSVYGESKPHYLSRYYDGSTIVSYFEDSEKVAQANRNLNSGLPHSIYLNTLTNSATKKIKWFDNTEKTINWNVSLLPTVSDPLPNLVELSKKISQKTINYKV